MRTLSVALFLVGGCALAYAFTFPPAARIAPAGAAAALTIMALLVAVDDFTKSRAGETTDTEDPPSPQSGTHRGVSVPTTLQQLQAPGVPQEEGMSTRGVLTALGMLLAFFATIWLLGLAVGASVYAAGFARWHGNVSWIRAILFGLGLGVFIFLVFQAGLELRLYRGAAPIPWPWL